MFMFSCYAAHSGVKTKQNDYESKTKEDKFPGIEGRPSGNYSDGLSSGGELCLDSQWRQGVAAMYSDQSGYLRLV